MWRPRARQPPLRRQAKRARVVDLQLPGDGELVAAAADGVPDAEPVPIVEPVPDAEPVPDGGVSALPDGATAPPDGDGACDARSTL